jgi:hypothetical protein
MAIKVVSEKPPTLRERLFGSPPKEVVKTVRALPRDDVLAAYLAEKRAERAAYMREWRKRQKEARS